MLDFPIKTLNTIKSMLLRQQKEVEENISDVAADDPAKTPTLAESSEPGTDSYVAYTHNKIEVLQAILRRSSQNIRRALAKIRNGTFGKCEKCGLRIETGRLLAMPTAQYCLSCSKKTTKERR